MEQINKALEGFGQQQTRSSYVALVASYASIDLFTPPPGTCSSIGKGVKDAPGATFNVVMGIPSSVKSGVMGARDYICTLPGIRGFVG